MFAPHVRPAPAEEQPEWEPYGLSDGRRPALERHRETGEVRVNPDALARMIADWEATADAADE